MHGHGTGDLLDAVIAHLPDEAGDDEDDEITKVAIIGKPNVGKSSLINAICGENRVIVSDIAGTTRDATDTPVTNKHGKFILIDTAGLRRKSKVDERLERFSVLRAVMAVERANVCVIVIDATEGFTEQDSKTGYRPRAGKAPYSVKVGPCRKGRQDHGRIPQKAYDRLSLCPTLRLFSSPQNRQRDRQAVLLIKYVDNQNSLRFPRAAE